MPSASRAVPEVLRERRLARTSRPPVAPAVHHRRRDHDVTPSARVSTFVPSLPVVFLHLLPSGCRNTWCLPPRGVSDMGLPARSSAKAGSAGPRVVRPRHIHYEESLRRDPDVGVRVFLPPGSICVASVVASLNPRGVRGTFSPGAHGKTGYPRSAYSKADVINGLFIGRIGPLMASPPDKHASDSSEQQLAQDEILAALEEQL